RHSSFVILEKLPFLALSAITCFLTISAQHQAYSTVSTAALPVGHRLAHALVACLHYLSAMFVPVHLAAYYPYETVLPTPKVILAGIILILITGLALRFARRAPWLIVGWLWYLGTLVPVIGLVQVGDQAWADRYTYLPSIGLFIAIVWGTTALTANLNRNLNRYRDALAPIPTAKTRRSRFGAWNLKLVWSLEFGVWSFFLGILSFSLLLATSLQLRYWKNTRALFEHAAAVTHNNGRAITVLGSLLAKEGKLEEAMALYLQALSYKAHDPEAHFFLGNALEQQGKLDEAIAEYDQALWFKPLQGRTHLALGMVLAKQNKYDEAAAQYQAALAINPDSAAAQNNFARLLHTQGRLDEAIEHYSAAIKLQPNLAQAHNNLGVLLLQKGRLSEGVAQLREALRLRPGDTESLYNLAIALNQQENWKESAEIFARLAPGKPNDPKLHYEFGLGLSHLQKTREAMSHYAHALLLQPDFPDALDRLSWILATDLRPEFRNGTEAVRMAERACELTGRKDPQKLATLAAAYGETGRFQEAAAAALNAQDLASSAGRNDLAGECRRMLESFKSDKPWRAAK
ncbi:MAG: protein O-mannosyl-transferase, partial [Verrucomicrobiota bacterium]